MPPEAKYHKPRTAVLVVHGMGSQRPLDTARGIVEAVCRHTAAGAQHISVRTHPERTGTDIDLPVISLIPPPGMDGKRIDFHEIYWAHLMSETRAVAVLLWLFELARKGPRVREGMLALWYGIAIFLCLLVLSIAFLAIQGIVAASGAYEKVGLMLSVPLVIVLAVAFASLASALFARAFVLARWNLLAIVIAVGLLTVVLQVGAHYGYETFVAQALPIFVAGFAVWLLMGTWGLMALFWAALLSLSYSWILPLFLGDYLTHWPPPNLMRAIHTWDWWQLDKTYTSVGSWLIIVTYLTVNAFILQPYIGDAARYYRNAPSNVAVRRKIRKLVVDTLEGLHESGKYDRIIVVAHSLGSVIAYDMLRAYFGRICSSLPTDPKLLGKEFELIDAGNLAPPAMRKPARLIVARMAMAVAAARAKLANAGTDSKAEPSNGIKAWLVTDFITLGSPLTHALYLMCTGTTKRALEEYFQQHVEERDFPVCPPKLLGSDGRLTFQHPHKDRRQFHHGAQFGLTRWTNLYFPCFELLWGDVIGGPLRNVFGEGILDVPVSMRKTGAATFFAHAKYWHIEAPGGHDAPHIVALNEALDLDDADAPRS